MVPEPQQEHRARARAFGAREIAGSVSIRDRESRWDGDLFRRMGGAGLLGAGLPRAHGGSEMPAADLCELLSGFGEGSGDAGLGLAWVAHAFGCGAALLRSGTEEQRSLWLPDLGRGERIGAVAHAESDGDTVPLGIRTHAVFRGGRWVLRGRKTWVVNGPVADVFVITAVTDEARREEGISAFLVPKNAPGLRVGRRIETMGMRTAMIGEVVLEDCEVPADGLLGAPGTGLSVTHRWIQRWQRAFSFAPWTGLLRSLVEHSVARAREWSRQGRPAASTQSRRGTLVDMQIRQAQCERLQARAALQLDRVGASADRDIAVAGLFLSESALRMTQDAARIHGRAGTEADRLTERLYRDAAVAGQVGDADDLLRSVIAGSLLHLG